jgi:hypothetical protein
VGHGCERCEQDEHHELGDDERGSSAMEMTALRSETAGRT